MNRFFKFSFFILINSHCLYAQNEWHDLTPSQERNFFDIQSSFENEMGNQVYSKGKGIKQFRRWEYYWGGRVDEIGNFPPAGNVQLEMLELLRISSSSEKLFFWFGQLVLARPCSGSQ